jgi:hypothetical protein
MTASETTQVAAFLADAWIDVARHYGNPMTDEQEQLARLECTRFLENQRFLRDSFFGEASVSD